MEGRLASGQCRDSLQGIAKEDHLEEAHRLAHYQRTNRETVAVILPLIKMKIKPNKDNGCTETARGQSAHVRAVVEASLDASFTWSRTTTPARRFTGVFGEQSETRLRGCDDQDVD